MDSFMDALREHIATELRPLQVKQAKKVTRDLLHEEPDEHARGYREGYGDALDLIVGGLEELLEDYSG